jgi:hypothetical protein
MASNRSCSMVTWTIFRNHLLEVGLTQNQKLASIRMLTTVDSFIYLSHVKTHMNRNALKYHLVEGFVTYDLGGISVLKK